MSGHGTVLKSHDLVEADAEAFRTSACEIPNRRAILDGVTPALRAARTAFNLESAERSQPSPAVGERFHRSAFCGAAFAPPEWQRAIGLVLHPEAP
jgi:hypothetical protein